MPGLESLGYRRSAPLRHMPDDRVPEPARGIGQLIHERTRLRTQRPIAEHIRDVCIRRALHARQMHFVSLRENPQPLAAHRVEIRAHEEMHIVPRVREHPAIVAADRAGTNHCDFSERRPIHRPDSIPQSAMQKWARRDSNPEPRDYESPALTVELQALLPKYQMVASL